MFHHYNTNAEKRNVVLRRAAINSELQTFRIKFSRLEMIPHVLIFKCFRKHVRAILVHFHVSVGECVAVTIFSILLSLSAVLYELRDPQGIKRWRLHIYIYRIRRLGNSCMFDPKPYLLIFLLPLHDNAIWHVVISGI